MPLVESVHNRYKVHFSTAVFNGFFGRSYQISVCQSQDSNIRAAPTHS